MALRLSRSTEQPLAQLAEVDVEVMGHHSARDHPKTAGALVDPPGFDPLVLLFLSENEPSIRHPTNTVGIGDREKGAGFQTAQAHGRRMRGLQARDQASFLREGPFFAVKVDSGDLLLRLVSSCLRRRAASVFL
jgi:hypothetical protein